MVTTEAIILAGGFGTRLQTVVHDVPKPMAPVCGRPFLEFQLDYLCAHGISHVVLSTGHLSEVIVAHFGSQYKSIKLDYAVETTPLGTGGAIVFAAEKINGDFFWVLNGDSLFDVDLAEMEKQHFIGTNDFSLALRKVEDVSRYGEVETDSKQKIIAFNEKSSFSKPGYINGGVYFLQKAALLKYALKGKFSIEKEIFMARITPLVMKGFYSDGYFIDIGIPTDYQRAQDEFRKR